MHLHLGQLKQVFSGGSFGGLLDQLLVANDMDGQTHVKTEHRPNDPPKRPGILHRYLGQLARANKTDQLRLSRRCGEG